MTHEGFKRKLAAILSADVVGYSRLMRADEDSTIRTLSRYRSAISNLIQKFRGHVVDATGDNLLAEFTSVVDAVNSAVEIQDEITLKILREIGVKLTEGERISSPNKITTNIHAFEKMMEGVTYLRAFNIESNATARRLSEEAIALDPEYFEGYNLLAAVNIMDVWLGSSKSPRKSLAQATELLQNIPAMLGWSCPSTYQIPTFGYGSGRASG